MSGKWYSLATWLHKRRASCGIFYIATGSYTVLWDAFRESCDKNFLPGVTKEYTVFTDLYWAAHKEWGPNTNVVVIPDYMAFGLITSLYRFHLFLSVKDSLKGNDWAFFFNANCEVKKKVSVADLFPRKVKNTLVGVEHTSRYFRKEPQKGAESIMGGFFGGKTSAFLSMSKALSKRISDDSLSRTFPPDNYDQDYLNEYFRANRNEFHVLDARYLFPGYLYPKNEKDAIIAVRNKEELGVYRKMWDMELYRWRHLDVQVFRSLFCKS